MPTLKRFKTIYPGVSYIEGKSISTGKAERIYYIRYRIDGKQIEEKAGRQFQDAMSAAKAAHIRTERIERKQISNKAQREAKKGEWTINNLWLEYKKRNPGLKGFIQDENRFINYIMPLFGNKKPNEITQSEVDNLRLNLSISKKPATVKNILELLRRIIMFGEKKQLCERINFIIQMPKINNEKTEDLTPEQLKRLLEVINKYDNIQAANFMLLILFTGMRRGELFRLKWQDVDFERGFIHICDPKGGSDQIIPLNASARKVLKNHPRTNSEYVFPGKDGKQRKDIKRQANRIKKRAGLPKNFRPCHGIRHVFASMLASSGQVDMYTLQKLLTHKSPLMTQRYAHLRDETLKRASNLVGELINQAITEKQNDKIVNIDND